MACRPDVNLRTAVLPILRYIKHWNKLVATIQIFIIFSIIFYYYPSEFFQLKTWREKPESTCKKLQKFNVNGSSLSTYLYHHRVKCEEFFKLNSTDDLTVRQCKDCYKRNNNFEQILSNLSKSCTDFQRHFTQCSFSVTETELSFPIAFGILVYKDIEQVLRLLRAIYRPHNYYCIHIDTKASNMFKKTLQRITKCYSNVFVSSVSADVRWGTFSVLEAELICLKDLWMFKKWKYFINLTGQDFPLKTNWELVQILKAYNGSNDIEGTIRKRLLNWIKYRWPPGLGRPTVLKSQPPDGITVVKGSTHIAASRGFVEYMLFNKTALRFLEWVKDIHIPDEHYFSTLNHNPQLGVPGGYTGDPDQKVMYTRLKLWRYDGNLKCHGHWIRDVCNFGVGDLYRFVNSKRLFLNKIDFHLDPIAFECAEQWYVNRTLQENYPDFDINFYRNLTFAKNHA